MDRRRRSRTVQHVDPPPYEYEEESESEEEEEDDEEDDEEATTATLSSPLRGEFRGDAAKRGRGSQNGVGMAPVGEDSERGEGWNREETEGLFCPICFEAWSNGGEHYPSCLPCGHLYGMSCIKKWFGLRRSRNKCPQCNTKCTMKDVRRIYGSRVLVHDDELQKRIQSLEAKCDFLEKKELARQHNDRQAAGTSVALVAQSKEVEAEDDDNAMPEMHAAAEEHPDLQMRIWETIEQIDARQRSMQTNFIDYRQEARGYYAAQLTMMQQQNDHIRAMEEQMRQWNLFMCSQYPGFPPPQQQ